MFAVCMSAAAVLFFRFLFSVIHLRLRYFNDHTTMAFHNYYTFPHRLYRVECAIHDIDVGILLLPKDPLHRVLLKIRAIEREQRAIMTRIGGPPTAGDAGGFALISGMSEDAREQLEEKALRVRIELDQAWARLRQARQTAKRRFLARTAIGQLNTNVPSN
ncbi:hypothetical protein EDC01DRAFT_728626 [Geopyxis carbonaria]|nr:hypothetical protein EDC01DRAFT_728626 [Geopyxis carbonaria]